jgi:LPS-assembly lipoprotein
MTLRRAPLLLPILLAALMAGCGFHLRREAALPASMQRVHIAASDPSSQLARDLARALPRSGAEVVAAPAPGVAVLAILVDTVSTDVLSVSGTARANEYSLRHHVEFQLTDPSGTALLPRQVIELTREFTFDARQALGVASETDLLTQELEREMVQAILRRLEALGDAHAAAG